MEKHTRGPWGLAINNSTHKLEVIGGDRRPLPKNGGVRSVAILSDRLVKGEINDYSNIDGETEANAQLIAASPELLDALKEAVSLIEDVARESATERFYQRKADELQKVIGKAEGK